MNRHLALELVRVTEAAALASARWMGRGDSDSADRAAVDAMRAEFERIPVRGTVVIGEGELDKAPRLAIGEKVGCGGPTDPRVDIAVDPLEGTAITARGGNNALAVAALASAGGLLHAPDTYMHKIAVGPEAVGKVDLDASTEENLRAVALAKGMDLTALTVCVLDRPRHDTLIAEIRALGARIRLIKDGDVSAAIAAADPRGPIDILMGIGGAPEGVLAAAAIRAIGGDLQGRLRFVDDACRARAVGMGHADPDRKFTLTDLASGDVIFAATGVTDGDFLDGVRYRAGGARTHSVVMRSATGTVRRIVAEHDFRRGPARPYMDAP